MTAVMGTDLFLGVGVWWSLHFGVCGEGKRNWAKVSTGGKAHLIKWPVAFTGGGL